MEKDTVKFAYHDGDNLRLLAPLPVVLRLILFKPHFSRKR